MTMRLREGMGALPPNTAWRFFPWFVAAGMAVVIGVNAIMITSALRSFPGSAGSDGFDLSNHYDRVIDRMARQAALGWTARAEADAAGHPIVVLLDRFGAPLAGAEIRATAERPVGAPLTAAARFTEISPGRYVGDLVLETKGQWDLSLSVRDGGHDFATTRRIVAR